MFLSILGRGYPSEVVAAFEAGPRRSRDAGTCGSVQINSSGRQAPLLLHLVEAVPDLLRDGVAGLLHHQADLRGASPVERGPMWHHVEMTT